MLFAAVTIAHGAGARERGGRDEDPLREVAAATRRGEFPRHDRFAGYLSAMPATVHANEQLEMTLGPLYVVSVDDVVSGPLTNRPARSYR